MTLDRGGSDKMSHWTGQDDGSPAASFFTTLTAIPSPNCLLRRVMRPFVLTVRPGPCRPAHSLRWMVGVNGKAFRACEDWSGLRRPVLVMEQVI